MKLYTILIRNKKGNLQHTRVKHRLQYQKIGKYKGRNIYTRIKEIKVTPRSKVNVVVYCKMDYMGSKHNRLQFEASYSRVVRSEDWIKNQNKIITELYDLMTIRIIQDNFDASHRHGAKSALDKMRNMVFGYEYPKNTREKLNKEASTFDWSI